MKQYLERLIVESSGLERVRGQDVARIDRYAELLRSYDRANVIGTRDIDEIYAEHVADSLSCLQHAPIHDAENVVDVGSGGGLPGIPLGIMLPETSFVLVEATGKKVSFLEGVIEDLGLSNVAVARSRVEDLGVEEQNRGVYDFATARALARLDVVVEYAVPLLKVGGALIAMKADVSEEELAQGRTAARMLGARIASVTSVQRSSLQQPKQRNLVVVEKVSPTSRKYPRRTGIPAKTPLGSSKRDPA